MLLATETKVPLNSYVRGAVGVAKTTTEVSKSRK